ncbi:PrnB family protein [Hyphococcus sp.]|uniref:PrnB family protein n=1 Tax=Hyphococcus sp. TaxID=2038636 RepID=UPI003CCC4342
MTLSQDYEHWIRTSFVEMNTALEEMYFSREARENVEGVGDDIKNQMRAEGHGFICKLLDEGNTDEGFENAFDLLGDVGLYMASMRRHEVTNPAREDVSPLQEASALAMHISSFLGVVPRFATAHLTTRNRAVDGKIKSFTTLPDEYLFLDYNLRSIFAFKRAAELLSRILPLGVTHPAAAILFDDAADALRDVIESNDLLFKKLDRDRFFYCVRPYYKPYRVARQEYRGANGGDFSGINEIDLLLGLCSANDPYYSQLLVEKMLFMEPRDQISLRESMRQRSFLLQFLDAAPVNKNDAAFRKNVESYLTVCKLHGVTARQHHDKLVKDFIEKPSAALTPEKYAQVTASGPPLEVLMSALEVLRDMRVAADRKDIRTAHDDFQRLRALTGV